MEGIPLKPFKIEEQPKVAQDPVGVLLGQLKEKPEFSNVSKYFNFSFLSPTQRAESMWAIFTDLKEGKRKRLRIKNEFETTSRFGLSATDSEKKDRKEWKYPAYSKDELKYAMLSSLYGDEETKQAYLEANERHLRESSGINGDKEKYHDLKRRIIELEEVFDLSLKDLFLSKTKETPEESKLLFELNRRALEQAREQLKHLLESNPKLQALSQYEDNKRWAREIKEYKFGQVPSRRELFERVEAEVATNPMPILLSGGSGTGKTQLAETLSQKFVGRSIIKGLCSDRTDFQSLIAKNWIDETGRAYYLYGPVGQALTGKISSLDEKPNNNGGVVLLDEFNILPPKIQEEILSFIEKCKPGDKVYIPGANIYETVAENFIFMAAINPVGTRFSSGRSEQSGPVARKFLEIPVDYARQTPEEPEMYELMLAALTDKNGRMVGATEELSPVYGWKEETKKSSSKAGESTQHIRTRVFKENDNTSGVSRPAGGFLWRFAQAIGEINKSVSDKETVLKSKGKAQFMKTLVVDIGRVIGWIESYKKIGTSDTLEHFMITKFHEQFLGDGITKYTKEDKKLATDFFKHFGIETDPSKIKDTKPKEEIMTPVQMGMLSPRVKYFEIVSEEPVIKESYFIDETGRRIGYDIEPITENGKTFMPGSIIIGSNKKTFQYLGREKGSRRGVYKPYKEVISKTPEPLSNLEGATQEEAREILGNRMFGKEQVEQALNVQLENIPGIPFTKEQLEQAKEKGMDLILYTDKLKDGKSLTALSLVEYLKNKQSQGVTPTEKYPILYSFASNDWKRKEDFFTKETPGLKWKLVSREVIPNSTNQNYLDQTKTLANYVKSLYNQDPSNPKEIPQNIQQALDEFDQLLLNEPDFPQKVLSQTEAEWKYAAEKLSKLQLTQLFRESFVENLYRLVVIERVNQEQLMKSMYSWTKSLAFDGALVSSGRFGETGANVNGYRPGYSDPVIGFSFSVGVL